MEMSLASYIGCDIEIPINDDEYSDETFYIGCCFIGEFDLLNVTKYQFTTSYVYEVSSHWRIEISEYMNPKTCVESKKKMLVSGFHWSDTEFYEYDKQTKSKSATFYHPSIKKYYNGVQNELGEVSEMENHVAEVAISFDKPYTLQEIQAKIPDNLNIVWLYMASPISDESKGPAGMPVYGFELSDNPKESYSSFVDGLKEYDSNWDDETIQEFLKVNKNKQFGEVKILGVMLTGKTNNFKALENQDFIRGASVGATAQIVPYIKPEK